MARDDSAGDALRAGIVNMLRHCAGLRAGQTVLILSEPPGADHYDPALAPAVAEVAADLGLQVAQQPLAPCPEARPPAPAVLQAMAQADGTILLTRRGDQLRFDPVLAGVAPVMCYALDRGMMASGFGQADHRGLVALLGCLNAALAGAQRIRVTCPLGTDFAGPGARFPDTGGEVTVRRFPLSVFSPVPAGDFSGQIAQAGFLTGTGRSAGAPLDLPLADVLRIRFDGTRITGFDGPDAAAAAVHFDRVAALRGTEARHVHSWHAGIHPGCAYDRPAGDNPERWGGAAFGNPRVLHFHSCGSLPPGEISINVIDPTIRLDGVAVWENGRLWPERVAGGAALLARFPDLAALFAAPARAVGLGPSGRLEMAGE